MYLKGKKHGTVSRALFEIHPEGLMVTAEGPCGRILTVPPTEIVKHFDLIQPENDGELAAWVGFGGGLALTTH